MPFPIIFGGASENPHPMVGGTVSLSPGAPARTLIGGTNALGATAPPLGGTVSLSPGAPASAMIGGTVSLSPGAPASAAIGGTIGLGHTAPPIGGTNALAAAAIIGGTIGSGMSRILHGTLTLATAHRTLTGGTLTLSPGAPARTLIGGTLALPTDHRTLIGGTLTLSAEAIKTLIGGTVALSPGAPASAMIGGTLAIGADHRTLIGGTLTLATGHRTLIGGTVELNEPADTSARAMIGGTLTLATAHSTLIGGTVELAEKHTARTLLGGTVQLASGDGPAAVVYVHEVDLYLDGRSIYNAATKFKIEIDEESIHNAIEIESIDRALFMAADPDINYGEMRLEAQIDGESYYFLLEDREGGEIDFRLWGRSVTAQDDEPYASDWAYTVPASTSAQDVIAEMVTTIPVAYDAMTNWNLPEDTELGGSPLEAAREIMAAVGAIIRADVDGTALTARRRFEPRPFSLQITPADLRYDRGGVMRIDYRVDRGTPYNYLQVDGASDDEEMPDIEFEESSPIRGTDVHLRVFWRGRVPDAVEGWVSAGRIDYLGKDNHRTTEQLIFSGGKASVSKPVAYLFGADWIGANGGEIGWTQYSKDLVADAAFGVANVEYQAEYHRYRCSLHDVETLLAVLTFDSGRSTSVRLRFGDGDAEAPAISNDLITNDFVASEFGRAWFYENCYDTVKLSISAPHDAAAVPGATVYIDNAEIGVTGNFYIRKTTINVDGPKVWDEIEIEKPV